MKKIVIRDGEKLPMVEHFYTLQGEGYHTGRAAYFIRVGGCDVGCSWCDSRYTWNPDIHPLVDVRSIVKHVTDAEADSVVVTGGEPLMWDMNPLCSLFRKNKIKTYLETSGAYYLSGDWDWICLSPKINAPPVGDIALKANELKVIIQKPEDLKWAEEMSKTVNDSCELFLQAEWSSFDRIIGTIVDYIQKNHKWRISLQSHKYMKIP